MKELWPCHPQGKETRWGVYYACVRGFIAQGGQEEFNSAEFVSGLSESISSYRHPLPPPVNLHPKNMAF